MTLIHIHSALLTDEPARLEEATAGLSNDELARSARFRSQPARIEFVLSRWLLRRILAEHLAIPQARIAFTYNAFGKPLLCGEGSTALEFNLSHSRGRLLIAVCDAPVGIDIERIDPDIDPVSLAANGLPAEDFRRVIAATEEHRHALFFQSWTRWESCLKAFGGGFLRTPGNPTSTELEPGFLLWQDADGQRAVVKDLAVENGFAAAVAVVTDAARQFDLHWHDIPVE